MRRFPWFESLLIAGLAVALIVKPQVRGVAATPQTPAPQASGGGRTEIGEVKKLGDGSVCSWVRFDQKNEPAAIGVTLTESALSGLPTTGDRGLACCQNETVLHLPASVAGAPFTHIAVNWNPNGHIPEGIYDKPHFDFHFYMMDESLRQNIAVDDADLAKNPPAACVPAGHVPAPGIMKMGVHWIDPTSPKFNGKPFTKTFIYGACAGKVSFIEPMITKAYLESKPDSIDPIKQPKAYAAGYFPSQYTIKYDRATHEYTIALEGLARH